MTEHEKFKWINDTIGYELPRYIKYCEYCDEVGFWKPFHCNNMIYSIKVDVREIIYTTEFMDKFFDYYLEPSNGFLYNETEIKLGIFKHLDDPVSYLYNLLGGPTNK